MTYDETTRLFTEAFEILDRVQKLLLSARAAHEAEAARRGTSVARTGISDAEYLKKLRDAYYKLPSVPTRPWSPLPEVHYL